MEIGSLIATSSLVLNKPVPPFIGYKKFNRPILFKDLSSDYALYGGFNGKWDSETYDATCRSLLHHGNPQGNDCRPHLLENTCSCGIYSYRYYWQLAPVSTVDKHKDSVIAEVVNYGAVVSHTLGFRAEKTRIETFYTFHEDIYNELLFNYKEARVELLSEETHNAYISESVRKMFEDDCSTF